MDAKYSLFTVNVKYFNSAEKMNFQNLFIIFSSCITVNKGLQITLTNTELCYLSTTRTLLFRIL